jgi:uncharacterized protein
MILADTGPLVALLDPSQSEHVHCESALRAMDAHLITTIPVLTEAFYLLGPDSRGSNGLRELVARGDMDVWHFDGKTLVRAFELMELYADHPMDLAGASLVTAAESLGISTVFTLDRRDFETYRFRRGHRYHAFDIVPRRRH